MGLTSSPSSSSTSASISRSRANLATRAAACSASSLKRRSSSALEDRNESRRARVLVSSLGGELDRVLVDAENDERGDSGA